jgi:hypothetical protein
MTASSSTVRLYQEKNIVSVEFIGSSPEAAKKFAELMQSLIEALLGSEQVHEWNGNQVQD